VFARVVRYAVDPERFDQAVEAFERAALEIGQLDGLRRVYVMTERDAGRIVTVTLWESREALEASEVRASALRQQALSLVDGEIDSVDRLQVAIDLGQS
jgi:heme-degrading monooxygenase HmoA